VSTSEASDWKQSLKPFLDTLKKRAHQTIYYLGIGIMILYPYVFMGVGLLLTYKVVDWIHPLTMLDLVLLPAFYFMLPITYAVARLVEDVGELASFQEALLDSFRKELNNIEKYGWPVFACITALYLFIAQHTYVDPIFYAVWVIGLISLVEILCLSALFWFIMKRYSVRLSLICFYLATSPITIALSYLTAHLAYDILKIPAWIDLPVVSYVPMLFWLIGFWIVKRIQYYNFDMYNLEQRVNGLVKDYEDDLNAIGSVNLSEGRMEILKLSHDATILSPIELGRSFFLVGVLKGQDVAYNVGDKKLITTIEDRNLKTIVGLITQTNETKGNFGKKLVSFFISHFVLPRIDKMNKAMEKRLATAKPEMYPNKEAYNADIELCRSDLMVPVYEKKRLSYHLADEKISSMLQRYPSLALLELYKSKMIEYMSFNRKLLEFYRSRSKTYDTYVKYNRIKYHDLNKSTEAFEKQIIDMESKLRRLGIEPAS